jgi:transposase
MPLTPVGIDIAKAVFQVHYVDPETGEIVNNQIKRAKFLEYFANRAPCLIGMEACGGAQHWARALIRMGHQVILRGLLTEYGEVMGKGRAALDKAMPGVIETLTDRLPAMLIDSLREQWNGLADLDRQIAEIERRLRHWMKEDKACKAVAEIPGVGLLTATAAVATMGDPKSFRSGREFAACIGIVPRQTGTGGKVQLGGISKRGDTYLRTLLIHGARSVLAHAKEPGPWVEQISKRRPPNVVTVALANKMARTIWAVLAHDRPYQKGHVSVKPA